MNPPDTTFVYSNAGFSLAAAIAERATGQTFSDLLQRYILLPLNIRAVMGINHPARISSDQPWGHILESNRYIPHPPTESLIPFCLAPAGDVCIPIIDYARLLQIHLCALQGRESFLPKTLIHRLHNDGQSGHGMGWGINLLRGLEPLGLFSLHAGSTGTFFIIAGISHNQDVAFALATNTGVPGLTSDLKRVIADWHTQVKPE